MSEFGDGQQRALDDAQARWHQAIAALDESQHEAENLYYAHPSLLSEDLFWEALGALGGMTRLLTDLIEATGARTA